MRDYGKVHSSFWSSTTIRGLSEDGRTLAMYLLTSPHGTISGVFRLPDGYICEDMGWSSERVIEGLRELFDKGFANRCETTKWVYIYKHFEWNRPENPNQRKAAKKVALSVPDECCWKLEFMRDWRDFLGITEDEFPSQSETVVEQLSNPSLTNNNSSNSNSINSSEQKPSPEPEPENQLDLQNPEPDEPAEIPVAELPLNTGVLHPILQTDINAWEVAFPAVDVEAELKRMKVWLDANRRRRKTAQGIGKFIVAWLGKQQDKPRTQQPQQSDEDWETDV